MERDLKKIIGLVAAAIMLALPVKSPVQSRDLGQWTNTDPSIKEWFQNLRQPDNPTVGCCGEADGYYCDDVYSRDNQSYCRITDDRDDHALKRNHVPIGTEIQIPDRKFSRGDSNPTGHSIVFLRWYGESTFEGQRYSVYCFILNSGT